MCTIIDSDNDLEDGNDLDVLDEYASEDIFVESSSDEDDDHNDLVTTGNVTGIPPVMRSILLFLMLWQILFNVSDSGMYLIATMADKLNSNCIMKPSCK